MELREYQQDMVEKCRNEFRHGHRRILLQLPTGGGKSYIASFMAKQNTDRGRRVLFMSHRKEINEQIRHTFSGCGVDMDFCDIEMVQTISRHLGRIQKPSIILCDECAHSSCKTYTKVFDAFPDSALVGYTATPARLSGAPLGSIYDVIVPGVSMKWLIENGYLSDYKYYAPTLAEMDGLKKKAGEFDLTEQEILLSKPYVFGDVVKHYNDLSMGGKAICFCPSIKMSIEMADYFNSKGIPSCHLDGNSPDFMRQESMDKFRIGKIRVLCNVDLFSEGVSVNDCDCVIMLRRTASLSVFLQQIGRGLRNYPGKVAKIIDHVGNIHVHGLPSADRQWSLTSDLPQHKEFNEKGELNLRICQKCFRTFETSPVCPYCGSLYKTTEREFKQIKEAELKEIKESDLKRKEAYKNKVEDIVSKYESLSDCRNLQECMSFCKFKGWKSGKGFYYAKQKGWIR